jgi:putative SOS response-associated peptidase YedK
MCGRVIQSSAPIRYGIVDGMNVHDSRVHNYPPRWNGAPSQDLLVIRRNHKTGEVSLDPLRWGLIPYWCQDPKGGRKPINAKCETVRTGIQCLFFDPDGTIDPCNYCSRKYGKSDWYNFGDSHKKCR